MVVSKCTKFDKVVKREVCQITSRGTRVFGVLDGETKEAESNFLLAIAEQVWQLLLCTRTYWKNFLLYLCKYPVTKKN